MIRFFWVSTFLALTSAIFAPSQVYGFAGLADLWEDLYPESASLDNAGISCTLCHGTTGLNTFNSYGWDIRLGLDDFLSFPDAILAAETLDSDGQGSTNLEEIIAGTQPGWTDGALNTEFACNGDETPNVTAPGSITGLLDPVINQPPVVDAGGPYSGEVGSTVTFDASGTSDPDGDDLIYVWDFGDGSQPSFPSQSPTATHTYDTPGTYTVQVIVTDEGGHIEQGQTTAEITEPSGGGGGNGADWILLLPLTGEQLAVSFQSLGPFFLVDTLYPSGTVATGIGIELGNIIIWIDSSPAIFLGSVDRTEGTMMGIVFRFGGGSSIFFGEVAP